MTMIAIPPDRVLRLNPEQEALLANKRARRDAAIDALVATAANRGELTDRVFWAMVHDFEQAPVTTNLAQLAELDIHPPQPATLHPEDYPAAIDFLVQGLALLGIYILNSNHLQDAELYRRLFEEVITEPVRDIPPSPGVREFIDLLGGVADEDVPPPVVDRDSRLPKPSNDANPNP